MPSLLQGPIVTGWPKYKLLSLLFHSHYHLPSLASLPSNPTKPTNTGELNNTQQIFIKYHFILSFNRTQVYLKIRKLVKGSRICHPKMCHFGHKDYFALKTVKSQQIREKLFTYPLNCLNLHWKGGLYPKRTITRHIFLSKKLSCIIGQPLFSKYLSSSSERPLPSLCIPRHLPLSLAQDVYIK